MFGQSLLSAFGIACTTDTDQLFGTNQSATSIATYQLNNATTSIPSNTYPGTANNITYAAGKFGNAAVFNGSSSLIALPDSSVISQQNNFTLSFWVKPNGFVAYGTVFTLFSDYRNYVDIRTSGILTFNATGSSVNTPSSSITDSVWQHIAITKSSSAGTVIYVNGSSVVTDASDTGNASDFTASGYQNTVGAYKLTGSASDFFPGSIDQVRIFNTALPQPAITALYNETTTTAQSASIDYVLANPNSIAYYKMSNATDQLGNYNGTATNVNFNTEGKFGFAGAFNGSSSKIQLPSNSSISSNNNFSWSVWVNFSSLTNFDCIIGLRSVSDNTLSVMADGRIRLYEGTEIFSSSGVVTTNTWYHIVWTKSSTDGSKIYLNGSLIATDTRTTNSPSGTGLNLFGASASGSTPAFFLDGKIDQVRLYDAVLSASNVSTLYKEVECEPAAINALDQFNTVLYTGNNSTQSVTGVGFQPDFVWFKNRTGTNDHALVDSVRGRGSYLFANDNYAASTGGSASNDVTSFDSNGFSLGSVSQAGSTNTSGGSIVAWNWKAPLANLSTSFNGSSSYINLAFASLNVNNNFTWSFWYMFNTHTYYDTPIGFFMNGCTNFIDTPSSGELSFYDGNSRLTTPSSTFTAGTWYHVVVTKSSTAGRKFYVNGSVVATDSGNSNSGSSSGGRNLLGAYSSSGNPTSIALEFDGKLAQVRIFHSALTASQISDLYTEPAASNNTLNYPAGAGCIAAYPLQTNAVDLSGNYSGASSNVTFGQPGYLTSNTDGTIPSTVAANVEAGFSVVNFTSISGSSGTLGHGLGGSPDLWIFKRTDAAEDWWAYYNTVDGSQDVLRLNTSGAKFDSSEGVATNTIVYQPTASSGRQYIVYCFKSIPGYSKVGSYVGTGVSGNAQYLGFEPSFLMTKRSNSSGDWHIWDDKRSTSNPRNNVLRPNTNGAETTNSTNNVSFTTTGFELTATDSSINGSGSTYIFLAIA